MDDGEEFDFRCEIRKLSFTLSVAISARLEGSSVGGIQKDFGKFRSSMGFVALLESRLNNSWSPSWSHSRILTRGGGTRDSLFSSIKSYVAKAQDRNFVWASEISDLKIIYFDIFKQFYNWTIDISLLGQIILWFMLLSSLAFLCLVSACLRVASPCSIKPTFYNWNAKA